MKQNKLVIGILAAVLLLIWGSIAFRIKKLTNNGLQEIHKKNKAVTKLSPEVIEDGYTLMLNYPDPFLKKERSIRKAVSNFDQLTPVVDKPKNTFVSKKEPSPEEEFKKVLYYGRIGNDQVSDEVGFVEYNDKLFVLREGDTIKQVYVKTIATDSLVVIFQNKEVTIHVTNNNS